MFVISYSLPAVAYAATTYGTVVVAKNLIDLRSVAGAVQLYLYIILKRRIMDVIQNIQKQMETEVAEIKKIENGKNCVGNICW